MEEIVGTSNRILDVDLTTRTGSPFTVEPDVYRRYLGGKGLGLKLLFDRMPPGIDPLGEDNIVALMTGPLTGTGAPCSGRFAAVTRSPLTGLFCSSSCGGPFGLALKTAGYDGMLLRGRSPGPVMVEILPDDVRSHDAGDLWGLDTFETQQALQPGKKDGALVIGPAGENLVRYANVASGHRFLGRGGLGAVFGAKCLKALLARGGRYRIVAARPRAFASVGKQANRRIQANRFTADLYRNFGTNANTRPCNEAGLLPVCNFRQGSHAKAEDISGEAMRKRYSTRHETCKPCSILCGHRGTYPDGTQRTVPEYESVHLLGTSLGIFDADRIGAFNESCSRFGLDTISTGATLAFAMEAVEEGMMKVPLRFGDADGIEETIADIAHRRGIGDELAEGTRRLSRKVGGESFAMHVKGLELAAYDPRGSWGQGLAYAVANRGGCHLSAYLVSLEIFTGLLDPFRIGAKAEFVRFLESLTC
ncbi:MAG: aldehyde ferredoxin oxidoreductase, partial [Desulfobacteraceae bacterium]|nr:aldehyde ferredoxin oxidoreductase [Desulfobacteraceae bacterium]